MPKGLAACAIVLFNFPQQVSAQLALPRWIALDAVELASGSAPGAELSRVSRVAINDAGFVFVLDDVARQVFVFSPSGKFERSVGRRGQGPGEFMTPNALGFVGDTLWVSDFSLRRVTFFSPSGGVVGTLNLGSAPSERLLASSPVGLVRNGPSVVVPSFRTGAVSRDPFSLPVLRLARDGSRVDTLRVLAMREGTVSVPFPQRGRGIFRNPFARFPLVAVAPTSDLLAIVDRDVGESAFAIELISTTTGREIWSKHYPYGSVKAPQSFRDSVVASITNDVASLFPSVEAARRAVERVFEGSSDLLPAVTSVLIGRDSTVWLRLAQTQGNWLVLTPQGEPLAEVMLPAMGRLLQAQRSHVWSVQVGPLDVPSIVRLRVGSPSPRQ